MLQFFFFLSDQIFKMAERVNKAVNGKGMEQVLLEGI